MILNEEISEQYQMSNMLGQEERQRQSMWSEVRFQSDQGQGR
jgi:hypothetical protein